MAIQTLEKMLSRSAAVSQQGQNVENKKIIKMLVQHLPHCPCPQRFPGNGGVRSVWTISICVRMRYVRLLEGSPSSLGTEGGS